MGMSIKIRVKALNLRRSLCIMILYAFCMYKEVGYENFHFGFRGLSGQLLFGFR